MKLQSPRIFIHLHTHTADLNSFKNFFLVALKNINKLKHSLHALAIYDFVSLFVHTVFTLKLSGLFELAIYSLSLKDYIDREVAICQCFSECKIFFFLIDFFFGNLTDFYRVRVVVQ